MVDRIVRYISIFLALLVVLPLHEFAHAFVADKSGDFTPRVNGRYTLNPLAHFDVIGLVMFVLVGFGWAKPVPINPNNFKRYRLDSFLVSSAGVIVNYLTAIIIFPLFVLSLRVPEFGLFTDVLQRTLYLIFRLGIVFFVFNLIPIYPLDGFRILDCFVRRKRRAYYMYKQYGIFLLYALIFLSFLADLVPELYFLDILGLFINFITGYIQIPITAFWGLFF